MLFEPILSIDLLFLRTVFSAQPIFLIETSLEVDIMQLIELFKFVFTEAPILLIVPPMLLLIQYSAKRSWINEGRLKPEEQIHHQNKLPDSKWLSDKPSGVILGRTRTDKYVRVPVNRNEIYNGLIVGGAGSGKTSTLLMCTQLANAVSETPFTSIVVDPKGEQYHTVSSSNNLCLNPTDRKAYGYDPYYALSANSSISDDQLIEEFSRIARALIVEKDPKSSYWVNNARDLLTGLLAAFYGKGMDFIDSIDAILSMPISEKLADIYNDADTPRIAKRYLSKFIKETETESLSDVISNMYTPLSIFANADVQFFLQSNGHKASPYSVTKDGKSLYLCLPEYMLEQYGAIFRLIISQCLDELTKREEWDTPCFVLIDEAYAIGAIDVLKKKLSIARGLGVSIWLACQSLSQLRELYGKEGADIIQTNCRIKCFLDCNGDSADTNYIIKKAGKYRQSNMSVSKGGNGSTTFSYQEHDIFDEADLLTLPEQGKEIIVTPSGTYLIRKNFWFKDNQMLKIQKYLQKT